MQPETPHSPAQAAVGAQTPSQQPRRGFLTKALAILFGGIVSLVPFAAGLAVFVDPLRKRRKPGQPNADDDTKEGFIKVATLDGLLVGVPQSFPVINDRSDAWNLFPREPIGAVYLLRRTDNTVLALNDVCPHAGCGVEYRPGPKIYQCPCHRSSFKQDGSVNDPSSPSPRGLDELDVDVKTNGEIWVKFQQFRSGTPRKIPEE